MIRNDINLYFSGGTSNNDGDSSLGGAKSSYDIVSVTWTSFSTLTGVTIAKMDSTTPVGAASFDFSHTSTQLRWKSYGGTYGSYIDVSSNGTYDMTDVDGYYTSVTIVAASLPGTDTTDTSTIANTLDVLFDTLTKVQAYTGNTDYRGVYLTNDVSTETDYLLQPQIEVLTEQNTVDSGTATAATSTTLSDSGKSWTTNKYASYFVRTTGGTGAGQSRIVSSNTATQITVSSAWTTTPSTDTTYQICSSLIDLGFEDIYIEESLGTGDGSTVLFSGTLANYPVLTGQIQITDTVETFTDWDGDGTMTGDAGGSGSVTYSSGAYSVTFNTAPTSGQALVGYYCKQMSTIANETTAPTAITFTHPVSSSKLSLYNSSYDYIRGKGYSQAFWIRRKVYKAFDTSVKYQLKISGSY